jgi:TolA-binding protein
MLKAALTRSKLRRVEARIKKLHGLQKRNRKQIQQLLQQRDELEREKYEKEKAKLEAAKKELIEKLAPLEDEQRRLEAELQGMKVKA